MANILQSEWVTRQRNTATGECAGEEIAQLFEFKFTGAALAAGDIIELGILPAYNSISGGYLIGDNTTLAADVGIMSGEVGEKNPARLVGSELFEATAAAAGKVTPITANGAFDIQAEERDRSVGLKVTTGATPTAGQKVKLLLKYRAV